MIELDYDILASRAVEPEFYRAPHPDNMTPMEFQYAGVEYGLARNNHLFGDAPGLGKTCQSIMMSNAIKAESTLVIVPASLRLNWEREIWWWSNVPNVSTYVVAKASDGISSVHDYVIVSYDLLRNPAIVSAIRDLRWDHVVLDEAHYIKDPKRNKRTRAIMDETGIASVCGRITLASGTILPNQPIECYNAIRLLDWDCIDRISADEFRDAYYALGGGMVRSPVLKTDPKTGQTYYKSELHWSDKVRNQPTNLDDLQHRLRKHIMVRRLKAQVLPQLPPATWHPFPLVPDAGIRDALKHPGWQTAEQLYELDEDAFDGGIPIDGEISTARRELGEAKAPAVASYIEELLNSGIEKILVAAWHHSVIEILEQRLAKFGIITMLQRDSMTKRQAAVDKFQMEPRWRIMLGNMQILGLGHTLTVAQDAVLAEPDWVPGNNQQLLDRLHRIGQKGSYVMGHVPIVPGTIDERIVGRAIEKDTHIHAALDKH